LPQGFIRAYLARISLLRGDLAQAEEHVELGTRAVPEPNIGLPLLASTRTHLLVEQGRVEEAAEILRDVAEIREPRTALHLWLLGARTRVHAARGDHEAALADALACGSAYERWGATGVWEVPWRLSAADAYLGLGQRPRAAELVAEQLRRARSFGVASHIGVALRSFARLGDPVPSLKEAVELLRTSPARLELARALADLGHQQPRSRETLRQAAVLALECRATALAERLQGTLTARGGRAPRIQVSGVPALTPSERQVAALAADALTNRQIAERLYVTEKTVETHLSRAYRKLGVTSRTQLAVQMTTSR
jgi:DNA-binding CsgD family transcriptional regulator